VINEALVSVVSVMIMMAMIVMTKTPVLSLCMVALVVMLEVMVVLEVSFLMEALVSEVGGSATVGVRFVLATMIKFVQMIRNWRRKTSSERGEGSSDSDISLCPAELFSTSNSGLSTS